MTLSIRNTVSTIEKLNLKILFLINFNQKVDTPFIGNISRMLKTTWLCEFTFSTIHFMKCKYKSALAGVAQWIERGPVNQRVVGWFPLRPHAWVAGQTRSERRSRQPHVDVSLPLFLPPFPSLK